MTRPVKQEHGKGNVDWTKQQLINAAAEQFSKLGFEGASLSKIREKVDVKNSTIVYHFKSKQGLYLAVTEHLEQNFANMINDLVAQHEDAPALERFYQFCHTLQQWGSTQQYFTSIAIQEMMNRELHSANSMFYQNFGKRLMQTVEFIKGDDQDVVWVEVNWQIFIVNVFLSILIGQAVSVAIPIALKVSENDYKHQHINEVIRSQLLALVHDKQIAAEFLALKLA
ncbi:TetR/AcrR family transcriptional regulator [Thalassotalea psychrophila]|uniref:TetR/AcrR family transcriptional regulator n=1 Tax=Thalassotalea psychrophila TaxID=3065647 RepID=A0ABY9U3D0_9GAMM|nr:TetR/AcrR family transcriptional regulator [Colwelliaceae bacterium SQ149]